MTMNKIMNRRPSGVSKWYAVDQGTESSADVYIYAEIGDSWFGDAISAADFVRDVASLDVDQINMHINSPGGDVFDGIAIANVIRNHKANIDVTVDGLAASAASFIALAGNSLTMAPHSELMIHDAWGICVGNAEDMVKVSKDLERVSDNIASMYAAKAGDGTDWRAAMREETWFSAAEAVSAGLADQVGTKTSTKAVEPARDGFDLSIFAHAGRSHAPAPKLHPRYAKGGFVNGHTLPVTGTFSPVSYDTTAAAGFLWRDALHLTPSPNPPTESAGNTNPSMEGAGIMSDTLTSGLRERLGIPADADLDEAGLLSALDEALAEQTEPTTNAALPQGIVAVEEAVLVGLRRDAELGRQAREQQLSDSRALLVDTAISEGRIPPARRDHWLAMLAADPGAAQVLGTLAVGIVPLSPLGYTGGIDESSDDDNLYARLYGSEA